MPKMLTPSEIAERFNLHPNTVRDYLKAGTLPAIKLGRVWRIEIKDFEEFIRSRKQRVKR